VSSTKRKYLSCTLAWSAILLLPIGVIFGVGVPWWERVAELDRQIATGEDKIHRYQRLIASLPRLQAELEQERSNEEVKAFYYEAETPALAGAQLQREVQDMVREAGARLINAQFLPAGADEQPPRVRIRTQLQGKTDALLDVLFEIERARPFLFVDQMSVRASARRTSRTSHRAQGRRTPVRTRRNQGQLTIRLDVFGYALGENL
jgi:general secretion pathway protein M